MSSDLVLHLNQENFEATLSGTPGVLLVDFWAPWCGPCKAIGPILDEVAAELKGQVTVAKVNIDDNADIAARFAVRAIPTLIIFKNGQSVEQMVGMKSKADLIARLQASS
jgi:thioredoxin 1